MTNVDIKELAKLVAKELGQNQISAVAGAQLPTFDISAAAGCCEGHCPCDSRNGGQCPCASKCGCDGKVAHHPDDMILIARLAELDKANLQKIIEVAPVIAKVKGLTSELKK